MNLVDELWFVVSPRNPLKEKNSLMHDSIRLTKVREAVAGISGARVSDIEFHLPKPSYMYLTLSEIQKQHPNDTIFLIIGADNWLCFDEWKKHEEILNKYNILIYPRPGYDIDESLLPANVEYLKMPVYNISSSQIREMTSHGEDVSKYLP